MCILFLRCSKSFKFFRFNLYSNFHLEDLIEYLPDQVTGAELYGICHNAWLNSARRVIHKRMTLINGKSFLYCNINSCTVEIIFLLLL